MGGKGSGVYNEKLRENSQALPAFNARYKELADRRRKNKKYKQEFFFPMLKRLEGYIEERRGSELPLTIAGMILASCMCAQSFQDMRKGKFDFELLVYADENGLDLDNLEGDNIGMYYIYPTHIREDGSEVLLVPASEIIERAIMLQQEETETRLYEKGRVGDIFSLKAQHGWQEEEKQQVTNNTLYIATESEAKRALASLLPDSNGSTD